MSSSDAKIVLDTLRDGARTLLRGELERAAQEGSVAPLGQALEQAIHTRSVRASKTDAEKRRRAYSEALGHALDVLRRQNGPFPDDTVARQYASGELTADDVVGLNWVDPDERETIRRLFVRTLVRHDAFARDRPRALETARLLELSCFNAVVRACKNSEEPPRRNWDSPTFVDNYSTRCGTVASLLDPDSSACRAYGSALAPRLLDGSLAPEAVGGMAERDLCPAAAEGERRRIAERASQKVAEKASNMFRCPHCGARRCTYREVQNRSLDEAPDYLCYCLDCERRFTGRS
ncbi:MAG: hypothetical protein WC700_10085 [Gemmatimonadaceae bacterium]|jgi:hypothetical protein